jgi:hypothetical protein
MFFENRRLQIPGTKENEMTKKKYLSAFAVSLCFLLGAAGAAQAVLSAVSPNFGPSGYPTFYQDANGRAVELCQDPALCLFDPVDPANPDSVALGVGGETFYWSAETTATLSNGGTALLVLALEAAFDGAGEPAIGQQIVFARIRVRIDVPVAALAGNWTINHPFGTLTIPGVAGLAPVNFTDDVGCLAPCDFSLALNGVVGPLLAAVNPPPPLGFLGDGATESTIEAGPGGTAFTVAGPGGITGTTNLFIVQGKLFAGGTLPVPLTVPRATFSRSATGTGQVDVFASTAVGADVTVTGTPNFPAGANPLTEGVLGTFFGTFPLADASLLPAGLTVTSTATDPLNPTAPPSTNSITAPLADLVVLTQADYIVQNDILLVTAESSDKGAIPPTLTATAFGLQPGGVPLQGGTLIQTGVLAPPADVTVTSSSGGSGSRPVNIITGNPGTISVNRAPTFQTRRQRLSVNGRIVPAVSGARVRIIGPNGLITEAVTSRTGAFRFAGSASLVAGDRLTFVSNGGALLAGQAVNVR